MSATLVRRRRREPPRPTLRGALLAGLGVIGVVAALAMQRADLFLVAAAFILAVAAAHLVLLLLPAPRLVAHRSIRPDAVNAGDDASVAVAIRRADGRPVRLALWRDTLPPDVVAEQGGEASSVPGDPAATVVRYTIRAPRRGVYGIGPLHVPRLDPLGLATVDSVVGTAAALLVRPRVSALEDSFLDEAAAGGAELVVMRRTTPSVDEVSARDYERGDPMRRVNWRASAKRGRLMVRQEEQRSNPQSWLLLDTVQGRSRDAFELAIELAASIGAHAIGRGFTVGIVETGGPQLEGEAVPYGAGYAPPDGERLLVAQLAAVDATPSALAFAPAASAAIETFADALRRSGAGTAAFAVLLDGRAERWRELAPVRGLAEPAVAFLLAADAEPARLELEAAGWICVVVAPATSPAEAWVAATEAAARRSGGRIGGARV